MNMSNKDNWKGSGITRKHRKEFQAYFNAKSRCTNPANKDFADYGGRSIEFRFGSFEEFLSVVGPAPTKNHTLDRLNNDGHYEPHNVAWRTRKQQALNRRPWAPDDPRWKTIGKYKRTAAHRAAMSKRSKGNKYRCLNTQRNMKRAA